MRPVTLAAILVLSGMFSPHVLSAQTRSDLSGTWAAVTEPAAGVAPAPSPILGARFGLRQTTDALTMLRPVREETIAVTFRLDGSRTTYRIPGRLCEGDTEFAETVVWEGAALALTAVGVVPPGGAPRELRTKRVLRMEGADTLIVEGTLTQAGETRTVATMYKRSQTPLPPQAVPATLPKGTPATIASVAWIPGVWIGTTGTLTVEERWTPAASGGIIGVGRTLRGTTLGSFEFLCIVERAGSLVYTAMPDGRTTPTHFVLTSVAADSATFENPAHDYPKTIRYSRRADGTLETTISGNATQRTQSFVLTRQP
jgi:hypothetical protein